MKKKLTNNLSLKILSIVLGTLLWLLVVILEDPVITVTIEGVTVVTENEEIIGDAKAFSVEGGSQIRVNVTGSRSIVSKLTASDITATADFHNMTSWGDNVTGTIPIELICNNSKIDNNKLRARPQNMKITLEDRIKEDFVIDWDQGTSKAASGYAIGIVTIDPSRVTISGPESLINIIGNVEVSITNAATIHSTVYSDRRIQIYDKNGAQFTESQMDRLVFSNSDGTTMDPVVDVTVELWRIVENIALIVDSDITSEPAEGYRFVEHTVTPKTINIAGTEEALAILKEAGNIITIHTDISLTDRDANFETPMDITTSLPTDIKLVNNQSAEVIIETKIEELDTQTIQIEKGDFIVVGLSEEFNYSIITPDFLSVIVRGAQEDMENLDTSKVTATIDLSQFTEADTYTVPVQIYIPDPFECINEEEFSVSVKIIKNDVTISTE